VSVNARTSIGLLAAALALAGCAQRGAAPADDRLTSPPPVKLIVPQHTGARAGNEPIHVAYVTIDGRRYDLKRTTTLDLPAGKHDVTAGYERCFHAPTQLVAPGANRAVEGVVGRVTFDAEPGETYVLGCTAGGGGAMIGNAHWVERKLADGKRVRVADSKMGSDFPAELLGAEPPEPGKSPGAPVSPR
jgi:hypothetical protein